MSHFQLPSELFTEISLYLNCNEILIIRDIFNVEINYMSLLAYKYPGFFKIIKTIKSKDLSYSYQDAYTLLENIDQVNIYSSDPKEIVHIFDVSPVNIRNIFDSYNIIIGSQSQEKLEYLYKYKYYMYTTQEFLSVCSEYNGNKDVENALEIWKLYHDDMQISSAFVLTYLMLIILNIDNPLRPNDKDIYHALINYRPPYKTKYYYYVLEFIKKRIGL